MQYTKRALTPRELIELCKSRGLQFEDEARAATFLQRVSFYRFKGYLLHFERKVNPTAGHQVPPGTTFENVLALYDLDRKLRLLFLEAIQQIEVTFRSAISDVYSLEYGPHWWMDHLHFSNQSSRKPDEISHESIMGKVKREIGILDASNGGTREKQIYIEHYITKYTQPPVPPSWMLCECLPLGVWSTIYGQLSNSAGQEKIAKIFGVPSGNLGSWLHGLTIVRNISAHHGRLWNRVFVIKPKTLNGMEDHFCDPARVYSQAFAAGYLLRRIDPGTDWHLRMKDALCSCPRAERLSLGTPIKWFERPFWAPGELAQPQPKILLPARK